MRFARTIRRKELRYMSKAIIIIFLIIWGIIWLPCAIWEKANEDERLDRFYEKLERKQNDRYE